MSNQILQETIQKFQAALDYLHSEYVKIQTGRANASLVENIMVENYGTMMPLKGLANISIPESKQIVIQPWNRDQLPEIEKVIRDSDLGLNPINDGVVIRLVLPPLTEERRSELVKLVHKYAEDARISIRNSRHDAINHLKNLEKEKQISEDELKINEKEIQEKVDEFNKKVEEDAKRKEGDVMTV